jgi:hypothetical protein
VAECQRTWRAAALGIAVGEVLALDDLPDCCRRRSGASCCASAKAQVSTRHCSRPAAAVATCTRRRSSASSSKRQNAPASRARYRLTDSATATPPTHSRAAHRFTRSKQRWATPRWPQPGGICTRGGPTPAQGTWWYRSMASGRMQIIPLDTEPSLIRLPCSRCGEGQSCAWAFPVDFYERQTWGSQRLVCQRCAAELSGGQAWEARRAQRRARSQQEDAAVNRALELAAIKLFVPLYNARTGRDFRLLSAYSAATPTTTTRTVGTSGMETGVSPNRTLAVVSVRPRQASTRRPGRQPRRSRPAVTRWAPRGVAVGSANRRGLRAGPTRAVPAH